MKLTMTTTQLWEEIERLREAGARDSQIGQKLGVSKQYIGQIGGKRSASRAVAIHKANKAEQLKEILDTARREIFVKGRDREVVRCELGLTKQALAENLGSRKTYLTSLGLKRCIDCKELRPIKEFSGTARVCKECGKERTRSYRRRMKEAKIVNL
jgi:DNA-binding XRE family transcriptional regulator